MFCLSMFSHGPQVQSETQTKGISQSGSIKNDIFWTFAETHTKVSICLILTLVCEPRLEKTGFLHMRKQRRRGP